MTRSSSTGRSCTCWRWRASQGSSRRIADTSGGGAVVLLDDMHAADVASLEAMRHLMQAAVPGVATVGAVRSGASLLADDAVRALGREGADVVEIEPLGVSGVADLVAALLDAHPPDDLVRDIVGRTDGVPLLVEEVVLAHLHAGTVEVHDGATTWRDGDATVPKTIRELIDARLRGLDPEAPAGVRCRGCRGGDFEPALIVEVAEADDAVVSDTLGSAVRAGLLETSGGVIAFRHTIVRDAVLDATVPHVVDTLHRRAAAALDRPSGGGTVDAVRLERRAGHLRAVAANDEAAEALTAAALAQVASLALLGAEQTTREAMSLARSSASA